jgi:hypothetical protein
MKRYLEIIIKYCWGHFSSMDQSSSINILYAFLNTYQRYKELPDLDVQSLQGQQDWKDVIHTKIQTCILCKFWIVNKRLRQLSCFDNFSFKLYKSRGLKVFFKFVNQYWYVIRCFSSVVAYCTPMLGVIISNPGQFNFFFHAATMLLFYIVQTIITPKFCIF